MIKAKKITLAVACLAAFSVPVANAGNIGLSVEVLGAFDSGFNPINPIPPIDQNFGSDIIYQLGLNIDPTPGAGERDFLNMALDIALNDLTDAGGGYTAGASPEVDINPNPIITNNQPVFATNQDAGAPGDLQGIIVSKAAPLTDDDPRTTYSDYPFEFGQIFVGWDGVTAASLEITGSASFNPEGGGQPPSEPITPFTLSFGGTIGGDPVLAGMPVSGSDLSAELQEAFNNRNGGPAIVPDAIMVFNDGEGAFGDLQTISNVVTDNLPEIDVFLQPGSGEGKYDLVMDGPFGDLARGTMIMGDIEITATGDPDGLLQYTFSAKIPEPSTVALASLALVGLVGLARRK